MKVGHRAALAIVEDSVGSFRGFSESTAKSLRLVIFEQHLPICHARGSSSEVSPSSAASLEGALEVHFGLSSIGVTRNKSA